MTLNLAAENSESSYFTVSMGQECWHSLSGSLWSGSYRGTVKVSVGRTIFSAHSMAVSRSLVLPDWA